MQETLTQPAESTWGLECLRSVRVRGLLVAVPCLAALATAGALKPRASGVGTHEQLGLTPCSVLVRTGWPCPSCGLTTSMAAMAHGQFVLAARAQPFGVALFAAAVLLAACGVGQALTGRRMLPTRPGVWVWAIVGLAGLTAGWAWKLAAGAASGEYPLR